MIWEKPASRTAVSLDGSMPASEIVSMPKSPMLGKAAGPAPSTTRSSAFIVHQLEHDAAKIRLGERAARLGVNVVRLDEVDAAAAQRLDGGQHIRGAQTYALQGLLRLDVENAGLGIDQLEVEPATRPKQDAAFGQDAVALLIRQGDEAEQLLVELGPVAHA